MRRGGRRQGIRSSVQAPSSEDPDADRGSESDDGSGEGEVIHGHRLFPLRFEKKRAPSVMRKYQPAPVTIHPITVKSVISIPVVSGQSGRESTPTPEKTVFRVMGPLWDPYG